MRALNLALAPCGPYFGGMSKLRAASFLSVALRGLLLLTLLAIAPLYETGHVMAGPTEAAQTMSQMAAHDVTAADMPAASGSHDSHGAKCRLLCFGWVDTATVDRPGGKASEITLTLLPSPADLLEGIAPAPCRHPPRDHSFV